jgi:hypothetical protein
MAANDWEAEDRAVIREGWEEAGVEVKGDW